MSYKIIEQFLIPDLRNIVCSYLGEPQEHWKSKNDNVIIELKQLFSLGNNFNIILHAKKTNLKSAVFLDKYRCNMILKLLDDYLKF
jgi:hypothetical protein